MVATKEFLTLPAALILDFGLGELPERIHPTVWMGKIADKLGSELRGGSSEHVCLKGGVMVLLMIIVSIAPVSLLSYVLEGSHWLIYLLITAILLKSTFAVSSMGSHLEPIVNSLRGGNLVEARRNTSRIVSRDTDDLDCEGVASAAIESTSESITDGVVAPIFFFALFGLPGAFFYRLVNTLDSMYGYKKGSLKDFGWAAANLDTILNYIPARLTAFMVSIGAWVSGENFRDSLGCPLEDSGRTSSPNAGWPMSAVAGALGIRLEKEGAYELNSEGVSPDENHVLRSFSLMKFSAIIFSVVVTGLLGAIVILW
ncbi:hypothetical protein AKJ66_03315 [candidate division MSBL1 archaeon SCGC-AAA259E22]|uniref:Probable cobalamin biosynthesis protein CobD n=1 Tax=candidate division MSBL1 archaeon SCGC-AAA259E22 TaxID=1698265 RepID=A0A133UFD2_9EURY|nr:hypothetical protein AKJ66_03315 [candidate division MSBL1 archaeon SCGC-AAA259E22]